MCMLVTLMYMQLEMIKVYKVAWRNTVEITVISMKT